MMASVKAQGAKPCLTTNEHENDGIKLVLRTQQDGLQISIALLAELRLSWPAMTRTDLTARMPKS